VDGLAQIAICGDLGRQLALGIDDEREIDFVIGGELLRISPEILRRDLGLVLKDVVAVLIAKGFGVGVEITRDDRGVEGPLVKGQREVVAYDRNLIGLGGFLYEGSSAAAIGTLQILEDDDGDLSTLGRPEGGVHLVLGRDQAG